MADEEEDTKIPISFTSDAALVKRIKTTAKAEGLSASAWVRSLIIRTFREQDEADKNSGDVVP